MREKGVEPEVSIVSTNLIVKVNNRYVTADNLQKAGFTEVSAFVVEITLVEIPKGYQVVD